MSTPTNLKNGKTQEQKNRKAGPRYFCPSRWPPDVVHYFSTHAPCLSLARVMHIKGAFFITSN
jgi:hypothetical protein